MMFGWYKRWRERVRLAKRQREAETFLSHHEMRERYYAQFPILQKEKAQTLRNMEIHSVAIVPVENLVNPDTVFMGVDWASGPDRHVETTHAPAHADTPAHAPAREECNPLPEAPSFDPSPCEPSPAPSYEPSCVPDSSPSYDSGSSSDSGSSFSND